MIIQWLLILIAVFLIGYQLLLGLLALMPQNGKRIEKAAFNHSFLLVIHLGNKEQEISKTLYSLYGLVYPSNLFEILVIADNCTDNTAEVARKFGAIVFERNSEQGNLQSAPLCQILEQIGVWEEKYDAIVFIKPGALVSGNFLEVMNRSLKAGSEVIQSSNLKVIVSVPWRRKLNHIAGLLYNHINSLGRKKMGLGTRLMGNGMCFKTDILKEISTDLSISIDDFKYPMPLLMNGIQIDFVPEAVVWSQLYESSGKREPHKMIGSTSKFHMIKKYVIHFIKNKSVQNFDALISLFMLPLKVLFIGTGCLAIMNWCFWKLDATSASLFWMWLILFGMVVAYLLIGVATDRAISLDLSSVPPRS